MYFLKDRAICNSIKLGILLMIPLLPKLYIMKLIFSPKKCQSRQDQCDCTPWNTSAQPLSDILNSLVWSWKSILNISWLHGNNHPILCTLYYLILKV